MTKTYVATHVGLKPLIAAMRANLAANHGDEVQKASA